MSAFLRVELDGALAQLIFVREKGLNILSTAVLDALAEQWRLLEDNPVVRVCILRGEGKVFLAGADIKEMAGLDVNGAQLLSAKGQRLFTQIEESRLISIAAMHGAAFGGGCELALACDLRICAEGAKFAQPEVNLGLIPGFGGTQRLTRRLGPGQAARLILSGLSIEAEEALRIGLVSQVFPEARLIEEARALASTLLQRGPQALVQSKRCMQAAQRLSQAEGMQLEQSSFALNFGNGEGREGMQAFIEKRLPKFSV